MGEFEEDRLDYLNKAVVLICLTGTRHIRSPIFRRALEQVIYVNGNIIRNNFGRLSQVFLWGKSKRYYRLKDILGLEIPGYDDLSVRCFFGFLFNEKSRFIIRLKRDLCKTIKADPSKSNEISQTIPELYNTYQDR